MNCVTHFMAKKISLPKLSQEIHACAEMANIVARGVESVMGIDAKIRTFPALQMLPLHMLQLGPQTRKKISVPKRRLAVAIDGRTQVLCPVKIIHAG